MNFTFLSPLAFTLLYALPLLLVPYLFRHRGQPITVPALFLYEGLPSAARRRLWGKPQLSWLFFFQLLLLLLLIAAAAQPFLYRSTGQKIAIVLDTSASMQAQMPAQEGRVFDYAKAQAAAALAGVPRGDRVSLFITTPLPTLVSGAPELQTQPLEHLSTVEVSDAPDVSDELLTAFFTQLFREQGFQRILFFTDRPHAEPKVPEALTVVALGKAQPNLSIADFQVYRSPFAPDGVEARVVIGGLEPSSVGSVGIEHAETGTLLVSQPLSAAQQATVLFSRLPLATTYRARIFAEDGLALDNEAYAVLPALNTIPLLMVTPTAGVSASLNTVPNLRVEQIAPQEYTPAHAARFPLVIFHLTAPEALPPTNAAFLLPPEGNTLFPLGRAASRPLVTQWSVGHPLTTYVTFALLTPSYGQAFAPGGWYTPVVRGTIGPLLVAGERNGWRYAGVGFDLLPYLGKQNLPASILTLNLLGWLAERAGQPASVRTGTTLAVSPTISDIRAPNGATVDPTNGVVLLSKQGVYTLNEAGGSRRLAANLFASDESQLGRPWQLASIEPPVPATREASGMPLWPWVLVSVCLLLILEWWWAARRGLVLPAT